MEHEAGLKWIVGWVGLGNCGRMRRLCHWIGDAGLNLISFNALRHYRIAAHIWVCSAYGRDGAELDDGQAWADLPRCRRLRDCDAGDLRSRWRRPGDARCCL